MSGSSERAVANLPRLHLVTNDEVLRDPRFAASATELLRSGGDRVALHLRGHGLTGREIWRLAEICAGEAARSGAWLLVNDRVDVALAAGARGAQLGRRSMRPDDARTILGASAVIGASVHDREGAAEAVDRGADFLLAGTLFSSASHPGGEATGVAWLADLATLGRRVIGIGGITPERVDGVLAAGGYGVAVLGGVWRSADPPRALNEFLAKLE